MRPEYPAACCMTTILNDARSLDATLLSKLKSEAIGTDRAEHAALVRKFVADPRAARANAISAFVAAELDRWKQFFDTIESKPLTAEQRLSVVVDEDATLVLAGAGSGKTSVITAKAAYLVKAGIRKPDEILLLAFAKNVAAEMSERVAEAIGRHVLSAEAIFADDTPVRMLAPGTGKIQTARLWTYARDERPWGGDAPPAAWYRFSGDRKGQHPKDHLARFRGWMHADGYAGFEDLYRSGAIHEVACIAHVRRKFVDIHRSQGSPIAEEAIGRIAQLYAVEKEVRGSPPDVRVELRKTHAAPVFDDLEVWLALKLTTISGKAPLAVAIRYALARMERLRPYLDHGILELENNAAERGMRAIALGRKNYLFVGSEAGGKAAAIAYTLIETAKLNAVDPHPWLADTLARIPDYKINKVDELLPWKWRQ